MRTESCNIFMVGDVKQRHLQVSPGRSPVVSGEIWRHIQKRKQQAAELIFTGISEAAKKSWVCQSVV